MTISNLYYVTYKVGHVLPKRNWVTIHSAIMPMGYCMCCNPVAFIQKHVCHNIDWTRDPRTPIKSLEQ